MEACAGGSGGESRMRAERIGTGFLWRRMRGSAFCAALCKAGNSGKPASHSKSAAGRDKLTSCNSSAGSELLLHSPMKIASRWGECLLPVRFLTVCAVNAQTWLNCYHFVRTVSRPAAGMLCRFGNCSTLRRAAQKARLPSASTKKRSRSARIRLSPPLCPGRGDRLFRYGTGNSAIGIYGQRYLYFLQHYRRVTYINLFTSGELNEYLVDIDSQAQERFFRIVKQMK